MKNVMTDAERQTLVTRLILDALYTRLTEYSTLVYSKHQRAIHDDLKTAAQFSISIKDLHFNDVKCTAKDMERILNFFACFENDNTSPDGIYYEQMQDEYSIQTKTEENTLALETILWNIKNTSVRLDKLYPIFTDVSKKDALVKIFRRKGSASSFLGLFDIKLREGTEIRCLHKRHELEMFHRRRIASEMAEQEELEEERSRVARENSIRHEGKEEILQEKRKGGKNRHKDTDVIKLQIIKPLYLNKDKVKGITVNARANKISELLNNVYTKNDDILRKFANEYSLDDALLPSKQAKEYFSDDKTMQIYKWCLLIYKGEL